MRWRRSSRRPSSAQVSARSRPSGTPQWPHGRQGPGPGTLVISHPNASWSVPGSRSRTQLGDAPSSPAGMKPPPANPSSAGMLTPTRLLGPGTQPHESLPQAADLTASQR